MSVEIPQLHVLDAIGRSLESHPQREIDIGGAWGAAKSLLAAQAARRMRASLLVIAPGRMEAEGIFEDLVSFLGEDRCILFPAWEVLPTDIMSPSDDIVAERMNAMERLFQAQEDQQPIYAVMPIRSLQQYVIPRAGLRDQTLTLCVGECHALDALIERLIHLGYSREVMVEQRGEFSARGGILDVFPVSAELPCRLELFGDEIDSLRLFEPETQRSVSRVESVKVPPRSEKDMLFRACRENRLEPVTRYFPKNTLAILDEPLHILEQACGADSPGGDTSYCMNWQRAEAELRAFSRISLSQIPRQVPEHAASIRLQTKAVDSFAGRMDAFWDQMRSWELEKYAIRILCVNAGERRRFLELLHERGYRIEQDSVNLSVDIGRLRAGFASPRDRLALLSEREIFGRHYMRRKRRRFEAGTALTQHSDLKAGAYIVHEMHGIGRYLGLRLFPNRPGDYLAVQYAGGDIIYIPATHLDQVQKYLGGDGATPKVDKIGGASWARAKSKVKRAIRDMTDELVRLYALRESREGHAFSQDTPWQAEFEDAFEYEETPDQARAIDEVKRDMESSRAMDRLVCGDVGYGKTEVALRAAFKAVMDRKQVALIAPTTLLAQQHYRVFRDRFADYPIRVEVLNRYRTPREIRESIDNLKSGEADVVIGTHRLLSKDVGFKDLGLVIIDEEQRFGVRHKERLKQMRATVDVLTMSATPIPRTLHFSLIGIRDMSLINTAPNDRLPIHTCVAPWDRQLIREALERELAREGQVFFLHNRVQTIGRVAAFLRDMLPRARIGVGHGQMHKHEMEDVMAAFINREIDILVCTTIIAAGIDIPNANTIIVDRADQFGLSQLYQIRGRVGRYKHRAFAYMLVPGDRALSEEAQQRLKALEDFSLLGSGFRIAMRDLEIRGAGDLLGGEQSGHIAIVGYETYKELIAEAVAEAQGRVLRRAHLPPFDIVEEAYIPDHYINAAPQKIALYRRIASATALEDIEELRAELKDRFGPLPEPLLRLLRIMEARAMGAEIGIKSMQAGNGKLGVCFLHSNVLEPSFQARLQAMHPQAIHFSWRDNPGLELELPPGGSALDAACQLVKALRDWMQADDDA